MPDEKPDDESEDTYKVEYVLRYKKDGVGQPIRVARKVVSRRFMPIAGNQVPFWLGGRGFLMTDVTEPFLNEGRIKVGFTIPTEQLFDEIIHTRSTGWEEEDFTNPRSDD